MYLPAFHVETTYGIQKLWHLFSPNFNLPPAYKFLCWATAPWIATYLVGILYLYARKFPNISKEKNITVALASYYMCDWTCLISIERPLSMQKIIAYVRVVAAILVVNIV